MYIYIIYIYIYVYIYKERESNLYQNDKETKPGIRYHLQPVDNELTLCVQWSSNYFQKGSAGCSGPMLH